MEKPFKKLLGLRIYLLAPEIISDKIHLSNHAKQQILRDKMKELQRLTVYAVGESVIGIEEGDEVLVGDIALMNAPTIELTKDLNVILVGVHDIVQIW